MRLSLKSFIRDEEGATMVEYGLLVALIAMFLSGGVALVGVTTLGTNLQSLYNRSPGRWRSPGAFKRAPADGRRSRLARKELYRKPRYWAPSR